MPLKNYILIALASFLFLLLVTVRYIFYRSSKRFEVKLELLVSNESLRFQDLKEKTEVKLSKNNIELFNLFQSNFNQKTALKKKDTIFRFLYLTKRYSYLLPDTNYLNCLISKCKYEIQDIAATKQHELYKKRLQKKYSQIFDEWYKKIGGTIIQKKKSVLDDKCLKFFPGFKINILDQDLWEKLEDFLINYIAQKKEIETDNKKEENKFKKALTSSRKKLVGKYLDDFNTKVINNKNILLKSKELKYNYTFEENGKAYYYSFNQLVFNETLLKEYVNEIIKEQYISNSLPNGSKPYSKCYGYYNDCYGYSCSQVKVDNGSLDVIVLIKDRYRKVVRHGYIKAFHSYIFYIPDGTYQVFFYSGSGWNPYKIIKISPCKITGGFVSHEGTTKDNLVYLSSNILTYQLTYQTNGNFKPKESSIEEAF